MEMGVRWRRVDYCRVLFLQIHFFWHYSGAFEIYTLPGSIVSPVASAQLGATTLLPHCYDVLPRPRVQLPSATWGGTCLPRYSGY
jgi:hypothetical protein